MKLAAEAVLKMPFDIQLHKATFINYLEVMIASDGTVMYAIPSHQEKLIALAMEKTLKSREELMNSCPPERYHDYLEWLLEVSNCVSVWNDFYLGNANQRQIASLRKLKMAGIYRGSC